MSESKIETGTEDLLGSLSDGVATLTMNRPQARNAMSGEMTSALATALADLELNPAVKCIVLTGAGKGFCAGGDVKGMASRNDGGGEEISLDAAIHRQRVNQRRNRRQALQNAQADDRVSSWRRRWSRARSSAGL